MNLPSNPPRRNIFSPLACASLLATAAHLPTAAPCRAASESLNVRVVETPSLSSTNPFYLANRRPLLPSAFIKLPIGSITPKGWLRHQLDLEANGMIGHLEEISKWCKLEDSAWASPTGLGKFGWEELPYWLKGYGDLGYVLNDETIIRHARRWVEAMLASQEPGGYFGPRANKTSLEGRPDLWPHMVMCNVLESFYEFSGDPRVLPFLTKYFQWLNTLPGENFGAGYWPKTRFGDNLQSVYWLYNRTGDPFLLELGKKIHDHMARWDTGVINWHNVNIAEGFREPAIFYQQAGDAKLLAAAERNYQTVMAQYGQFPGGGFAGDENCRPGFGDPRQGFETCGMVEFMHSFEMLSKISGRPIWADRCEEIAFNSLPAALTPEFTGLHYLTCANQVQLDKNNKAPGVENAGTMFSYSPFEVYRCCQHNVSHGWPYYAEELWLATADQGLCVSLYAASEVSAKVGDGATVRISEETDYPFSDTVVLTIVAPRAVAFPLYLRIPRWCETPGVQINGQRVRVSGKPLSYLVLDRTWHASDSVRLQLPMRLSLRRWEKNQNAVSVDYGPLTFSLKIGERWNRYGHSREWPEFEVFPTTPWNYGLVLDSANPAASFKIVHHSGSLAAQPFTAATTPVELRVKAKRIPAWTQDFTGLVGKLQSSPVKSEELVETVTLVPMGAARLRITAFPLIGQGKDAHEWSTLKSIPVSASHCNESDTVEALIDGLEPKNSNDHSIPRFTWWDHQGTSEWVQYDFGKPRRIARAEVYWFDDTGAGSCRVPKSWQLLYQDGERWLPVTGVADYGTKPDTYNRVTFEPVSTTALRLLVQLQPEYSGGILEWKIR